MKRHSFLFAVLLALFFISACKKSSTNTPGSCTDGSANFTWLGTGHELVYYFYSFSLSDDTMIVRNLGKNGGSFASTITFEPSGSAQNVWYTACGRDLYTSTVEDYTEYGHWWFSLDANVSDTWTRAKSPSSYNYKLYAKNVSVTLPYIGDTYSNCYKFTYQSSTSFFGADTIYFRPDIGIVFYDGFSGSYELARKNF